MLRMLGGKSQTTPTGGLLMPEAPKSLYARLGGYDALAGVVDDLLPKLREDPLLGRFWTSPRSVDTQTVDRLSGLPQLYWQGLSAGAEADDKKRLQQAMRNNTMACSRRATLLRDL
jgi:truncated hemoglobin YjbI